MDSIQVTIGGKQYIAKFTVPRLRQLAQRTQSLANPVGVGLVPLVQAAVMRNYDAITMLTWAALAHPDNPGMKDATFEDVENILAKAQDDSEIQRIVDAIALLTKREFRPELSADPQQPAAPLQ